MYRLLWRASGICFANKNVENTLKSSIFQQVSRNFQTCPDSLICPVFIILVAYNFRAEKTQRTMHKELIRQLLLHLSLLNADLTIQGLLFSDFQIKAFKEKYLITNRVKNEDCKIQ